MLIENVVKLVHSSWLKECHDETSHNGNVLFGEFRGVGCPYTSGEESNLFLLYQDEHFKDCGETIRHTRHYAYIGVN